MAALALIAGLSAVGTGIYTYILSHAALESHLAAIDSHMHTMKSLSVFELSQYSGTIQPGL